MEFRYRAYNLDWSKLPLGAKLRVGLTALGGLGLLALILSVSAALFLILAPIVIVSGLIGGWHLSRRLRKAQDEGVIDAHYVVIDREAGRKDDDSPPPRRIS
ncbi:MAG TPA: hypothetical protein PKW21_14725 [Rhabdaerophilum sp.]|nr:hypothetical protein [Rhabdaerophilum sp.]